MNHHSLHQGHRTRPPAFARFAFFGFLAIALVFLLVEHGEHLLGSWWLLLILACPLLHFGMHGGHGHGHSQNDRSNNPEPPPEKPDSSRPHQH